MLIHAIVLTVILLNGALTYYHGRASLKKNKRFVISSFILIFLVQALRASSVGNDTIRYERLFLSIAQRSDLSSTRWEPLYLLLNRLILHVSNNPQWLLVVCALIMDIGFSIFILKNTKENESAFWPVFLFICFLHYANSLNVMREYLAISIAVQITWVMRDVKGAKRWWISLLLILASSMFHAISIIMLFALVPYLLNKLSFKTITLASLSMTGILLIFNYVLSFALYLLPQYSVYLESRRFEGQRMGLFYLSYFLLQVFLAYSVTKLNPDTEENKNLYRLSCLVIISAGLLLFKTQIAIALRTGYYFAIFFIVYAPAMIRRIGKMKQIYLSLLLIYGIFFFFHTLGSSERGVIPYTFFWQ